ncbi:hypothetical protein [Prevotella sp. 10(H)]|uniref:hypothetical protein n=1 Tax=Prevotella sp. 10(H) TaxID=1158294 RepID=UPI0004A6D399|nr:hypothetical protein [Prevotella sp. 10(H)]
MKNLFFFRFLAASILFFGFVTDSSAKGGKDKVSNEKKILIVGLTDNVKSNHFYDDWIAEETGMKVENIDSEYNYIIADNIASTGSQENYKFIPISDDQVCEKITQGIKVEGEGEGCHSDLSNVLENDLQDLLNKSDADYLLVLNQHYLKYQERPMNTIFHIVSFTLFDKNKKDLLHGNNYFTSINLEKPEKVRKISRKSTSKIASSIIKTLEQI